MKQTKSTPNLAPISGTSSHSHGKIPLHPSTLAQMKKNPKLQKLASGASKASSKARSSGVSVATTSTTTSADEDALGDLPGANEFVAKERMRIKSVSFLDPSSLRWINRRRGTSGTANTAVQITPHKYNQLKEMFNGLDFDGGGEIEFDEFKDAIAYVEAKSKANEPLLGDEKQVTKIFKAMDADGSGTVDFKEFATAMTSNLNGGLNGSVKDMRRLQYSFYEFANVHRRQNIVDRINDKQTDDPTRCEEFNKLFHIEYMSDIHDEISTEEQIQKAKMDMKSEKKRLGQDYWKRKKQERNRSREADIYLKTSKVLAPVVSAPNLKNYSQRMSKFSVDKDPFIPKVESNLQDVKIQLKVAKEGREELQKIRVCNITNEPPVSIKSSIEMKDKLRESFGE